MRMNRKNDPSSFVVLPQDQTFILDILDQAIQRTEKRPGLETVITLHKVRKKDPGTLILGDIVNRDNVQRMSIHSACEIHTAEEDSLLFWAKYGVLQVIGSRGNAYTPLTLVEACNFQTNLDGRPMDISEELRAVCCFPGQTTFVQLYADTPHTKLLSWRTHPVSGAIATSGILHPRTTAALDKASFDYIRHMVELVNDLAQVTPARLEVVSVLQGNEIPAVVRPRQFINEEKVKSCLLTMPCCFLSVTV